MVAVRPSESRAPHLGRGWDAAPSLVKDQSVRVNARFLPLFVGWDKKEKRLVHGCVIPLDAW